MTERIIGIGALDPADVRAPWVLILGGVSREGNRRARRASRVALGRGLDVVWLDGYEETYDRERHTRVPLEEETPDRLIIIGYRDRERDLPTNRMALEVPDALQIRPESTDGAATRWRGLAEAGRRWLRRLVMTVRSGPLRRFSTAVRGYAGWRLLRPEILRLRRAPAPQAIVYGDDHALTSAWHAARIWPDVPVDMELAAE